MRSLQNWDTSVSGAYLDFSRFHVRVLIFTDSLIIFNCFHLHHFRFRFNLINTTKIINSWQIEAQIFAFQKDQRLIYDSR